ncbi:hypothetical protein Plhal304r1_c014g0052381 [Plasmopara halstedii]
MTMESIAECVEVRLKRKVRNAETKLFEWRPCTCTLVVRDGRHLLLLQTRGEKQDGNDEVEIVTIDVATELIEIVAEKNKTRCNLVHYVSIAIMKRDVVKQQLMASSATQCQYWIAQVRRLQQKYQQHEPDTIATRLEDVHIAPLSSFHSNLSELPKSRTRRLELKKDVCSLSQDDRSSSSSTSCHSPAVTSRCCDETQPTATISDLDYTIDSSSCSPADDYEGIDPPVSPLSSISSKSTTIPLTAWKRSGYSQLNSPYYSSSSDSNISHRSIRCRILSHSIKLDDMKPETSQDDEESANTNELNERSKTSSSEAEVTTSSQERSVYRRMQQHDNVVNRSSRVHEEDESSQAELHILQRVEAALRKLELENAQAKTRERELLQEIQTLRDAAQVAAAEHQHTIHEYRTTRRELDAWRRAAQAAEAAATQLEQQLSIAYEEKQLVASEKLRLKHQNNELRTQVHRLDSLVYGRF